MAEMKIALAGNPNSGKTTMFNDLTGSSQYVGNWPGVTVEKKEGRLKGHKDVIIQDLPGIYSLSPYTLEEVVSRTYILDEKPDALLNLVDASNLERNLYLTTQLLEAGIPAVIALNMMDLVTKRGDKIDIAKLSDALGCPIVQTSALKSTGTKEAAEKAMEAAAQHKPHTAKHRFDTAVEKALDEVSELLTGKVPKEQMRFYAIKAFERDEKALERLNLSDSEIDMLESIITKLEAEEDDDSESIITNQRYQFIANLMKKVLQKKRTGGLTGSDKIDRVVTNRFLALPIFAAVMWLVYFISVQTVGAIGTDWANDGVFGDGWHLFGIGAPAYEESVGVYESQLAKVDAYLSAAAEAGIDTTAIATTLKTEEPDSQIIRSFVAQAAESNLTTQMEITDEEGIVIDTLPVAVSDFEAALSAEEPDPASHGVWIPGIPVLVENLLVSINCADWLQSLILDGIIAGVGAVLGFLPQMMVLFLCLAILEDSGYMARIAFIMDRIFRKFGMSGKSFIPVLIGTGCGVPAIMGSRTIENEKDRRMTVMVTTFIPCSAKLPIIALIAGALFPTSSWVGPSAYFMGMAAIILSGVILKKTKLFAGDPAPFVMELPSYHMPRIKGLLIHMWDRSKHFIIKAGTIIFISSALIWFLSNFNFTFQMVGEEESILASLGNVIAPLFAPLGWGDWKSAVATLVGLTAKENVVGTFGILYGVAEVAEDGAEIWPQLQAAFTQVTAYSFLVFNLLCAPCFAAIGAIHREMGDKKWTWIAIGYQTVLAYVCAFLINQLGSLIFAGAAFGVGQIIALALMGWILWLIFRNTDTKSGHKAMPAGNKA